ncbi:hypothetical protein ACTXT7_005594 [Hymenolepis weldensis]
MEFSEHPALGYHSAPVSSSAYIHAALFIALCILYLAVIRISLSNISSVALEQLAIMHMSSACPEVQTSSVLLLNLVELLIASEKCWSSLEVCPSVPCDRSLSHLLRAIRNKRNHIWALSRQVREILGDNDEKMSVYWNSKFPCLLPVIYYLTRVHLIEVEHFRTFLPSPMTPQKATEFFEKHCHPVLPPLWQRLTTIEGKAELQEQEDEDDDENEDGEATRRQPPYHVESTDSRPITEFKLRRAGLVLARVTGWEYSVLLAPFHLSSSNSFHQPPLTLSLLFLSFRRVRGIFFPFLPSLCVAIVAHCEPSSKSSKDVPDVVPGKDAKEAPLCPISKQPVVPDVVPGKDATEAPPCPITKQPVAGKSPQFINM